MKRPALIGTEESIGLMGVLLIAGGLALERVSLCLLWLGGVALCLAWGFLKQPPRKEK